MLPMLDLPRRIRRRVVCVVMNIAMKRIVADRERNRADSSELTSHCGDKNVDLVSNSGVDINFCFGTRLVSARKCAGINSELSVERIQAYKSKGLFFLFIRKEDFARYVGLNLELTKKVAGKKNVSRSQKLQLMKHTSEILLQEAYVNGVDKQKMQATSALVEAMVSTLSEDQEIFKLIEILQTHSDHLYAHSLGVSLYSSMIAKEIGWTSTPTLFKITMGGLLHDIGKKEIDPAILQKRRQDLSKDERSTYETHPIRGKEILSSIKSIPEDVAQIALHHHENVAGRGFPFRIQKSKIHPLAKVISMANEFCDRVLKGSNQDSEVLDAHEALNRLYTSDSQQLDLALLRALMNIFKFPIPPDMPKSTIPDLN
jgi:putative nucleotidyltransferase with HDIG domain